MPEQDLSTRKITLEDVARLSGVSRSTASRALRGQTEVSEIVRDRVCRIADSLDYRLNRAAQNLAGATMSIIGLAVGEDDMTRGLYFPPLIQATARAAEAVDHGLLLLLSGSEPGKAVKHLLRDRIADGVVISSVLTGERWIEELLDNPNIPTVLIGADVKRPQIPMIDVENVSAAATIVGHLLDSGCERVGMISGPPRQNDSSLRLEGYRRAHQERNRPIDDSLIVEGDYLEAMGARGGRELCKRGADGIFAGSDLAALGVLGALRGEGVDVPGQVSVAGFDGAMARGPLLDLTTMVQPFDDMAAVAVRTLLDVIAGRDVPKTQLLPAQIHKGTTTR